MNSTIALPSIWPVTCHTDHVGKDSTFVAIKGLQHDGVDYIPLALQKGARTIVVQEGAVISQSTYELAHEHRAQIIWVPDARKSLALLAATAWGNPAQQLKIIGVTGTKGKTTTAWLLYDLLRKAEITVALLSTVNNRINDHNFVTELTTQQPDYLHAFFYTCVAQGVTQVIMEVAAQAVSLHRIADITFDGIIFTNFASAHGEFYTTPEEYFQAKQLLFQQQGAQAKLIINGDDTKGALLLKEYGGISFGITSAELDVKAIAYRSTLAGLTVMLNEFGYQYTLACPALMGSFNVYNLLGAAAMANQLGVAWDVIEYAVAKFAGVPGRLERYDLPNGAVCFIDQAHNPSSFAAVLPELRAATGDLIVVSGAGGDRDKQMRPVLGSLMVQYGDTVIITTDNPRSENPADIIEQIYSGIPRDKQAAVVIELDREKAIQKAYACSKKGSIIALLGKGPQQYQMIGTVKYPFSEQKIIKRLQAL
jgi:UDP-N-acetylmuramoyl-L-alanyl-D-glutamate--2,6-diaminopimelate ligase